jgi:hypothetical protein
MCVAVDASSFGGGVRVATHPAGGRRGWSNRIVVDDELLDAVSCGSGPICLAGGPLGTAVVTTHPVAQRSAWSSAFVVDRWVAAHSPLVGGSDLETSLACASVNLCTGIDTNGDVVTSTHPALGARAWSRPAHIYPGGLAGISCPSSRFCAAGGDNGYIVMSNAPAESGSWTRPVKIDSTDLNGLDCPSPGLCIAADARGRVIIGHR